MLRKERFSNLSVLVFFCDLMSVSKRMDLSTLRHIIIVATHVQNCIAAFIEFQRALLNYEAAIQSKFCDTAVLG